MIINIKRCLVHIFKIRSQETRTTYESVILVRTTITNITSLWECPFQLNTGRCNCEQIFINFLQILSFYRPSFSKKPISFLNITFILTLLAQRYLQFFLLLVLQLKSFFADTTIRAWKNCPGFRVPKSRNLLFQSYVLERFSEVLYSTICIILVTFYILIIVRKN